MPADVIAPASSIASEQQADIIRRGLSQMTENDRKVLWQVLELVDQALHRGGAWDRVLTAISLAPAGIVRDTAYQVAWLRFEESSPQPATNARIPRPAYKTKPLTTVVGRAADADCWVPGWTWRSFSVDALGDHVRRARYDPESCVLPVKYRHAGPTLGFSRRWDSTDDGGADVELSLLPNDRAQFAARAVRDGLVRGLSLAARIDDASWCFYSPTEWSPHEGRVDLERHHRITPVEISLTHRPAQSLRHSQVRHIW